VEKGFWVLNTLLGVPAFRRFAKASEATGKFIDGDVRHLKPPQRVVPAQQSLEPAWFVTQQAHTLQFYGQGRYLRRFHADWQAAGCPVIAACPFAGSVNQESAAFFLVELPHCVVTYPKVRHDTVPYRDQVGCFSIDGHSELRAGGEG